MQPQEAWRAVIVSGIEVVFVRAKRWWTEDVCNVLTVGNWSTEMRPESSLSEVLRVGELDGGCASASFERGKEETSAITNRAAAVAIRSAAIE